MVSIWLLVRPREICSSLTILLVTTYWIYAILRIYGVVSDRSSIKSILPTLTSFAGIWARDLGIDFLAVIACLLFPR